MFSYSTKNLYGCSLGLNIYRYILTIFRKKETILSNGNSLSILVLIIKETKTFKKGKIVWLEKRGNKVFLMKKTILLTHKEEEITLENCLLSQPHLDTNIINDLGDMSLILNWSYHKFIDNLS
ncbi:hypothetical protein I2486_01055 [Cellulophaga sp. E16_2]|uniref:hypothetical protein n=1 Tax=Cellulophaga sp. E16_2 TaxID=2789297 RepID=UPI001A9339DC|nr:hypothetical protein [Cellulophaga sp. E16_2]MBO0589982.1 hypothetical protein [Cellulophaga sp. E16_2]